MLDDPRIHHHDPVRQGHRLDLVMGHIDRGHLQFVAEILDLVPGRNAQFGVEVAQWFVHQEHVRLAHNGAGQGNALTLSA